MVSCKTSCKCFQQIDLVQQKLNKQCVKYVWIRFCISQFLECAQYTDNYIKHCLFFPNAGKYWTEEPSLYLNLFYTYTYKSGYWKQSLVQTFYYETCQCHNKWWEGHGIMYCKVSWIGNWTCKSDFLVLFLYQFFNIGFGQIMEWIKVVICTNLLTNDITWRIQWFYFAILPHEKMLKIEF